MLRNTPLRRPAPFLLLLLLAITAAGALRAQPYETLRHVDGCVIRATPIIIAENDYVRPNLALALNPAAYPALKRRFGINGIRLCWVDPWWLFNGRTRDEMWTVAEVATRIDSVVNMATRNEMMTIINYHVTAEYEKTRGFGMMAEFWRTIAKRYADNPYVVYEIGNEQAWHVRDYIDDAFEAPYRNIYEQVRRDAPERDVIIGSFHSMNLDMRAIIQHWEANGWIDWDHTVVGWHFYGWGDNPRPLSHEEGKLLDLISNYRTACTEWGYPEPDASSYIKPFFGQDVMSANLERFGISWMDWRDWNDATFDEWEEYLVPDAEQQNYDWDLSACAGSVSVTPFTPAPDVRLTYRPGTADLVLTEATAPAAPASIEIYDLTGRRLLQRRSVASGGEHRLSVAELPRGSYVLALRRPGLSVARQFVRY